MRFKTRKKSRLTKQFLIDHVGKKKGHFTNKANRIAKLIELWPTLESKLIGFIERGRGHTEQSRLAYAVLLMMETGIRTGNETSAEGWICQNQIIARKDNPEKGIKEGDVIWRHPCFGQHVQTFGLTTLQNRHVKRFKSKLTINFIGKKLVDQVLFTRHPTLCQYCFRGKPNDLFLRIDYHCLKKFVKKYIGRGYTPKDLRMAKVNLLFIDQFAYSIPGFEKATTKSERRKILASTIEEVANIIGHTKGVCKSAYMSQPLVHCLHNYGDQS